MSDLATNLAARRAIDRQMDRLICAAAKAVSKLKGTDMKENQIRNLVNVACATESMEAVTNFIRYQIGRFPRNWTEFGKTVIADIQTGAVKDALDAVREAVSGVDLVWARAELTGLYLGYLNRSFVYASKSNDWQNLCGTSV